MPQYLNRLLSFPIGTLLRKAHYHSLHGVRVCLPTDMALHDVRHFLRQRLQRFILTKKNQQKIKKKKSKFFFLNSKIFFKELKKDKSTKNAKKWKEMIRKKPNEYHFVPTVHWCSGRAPAGRPAGKKQTRLYRTLHRDCVSIWPLGDAGKQNEKIYDNIYTYGRRRA